MKTLTPSSRKQAHYVFGTADGALFALHAAISLPAIQKVAAYEPLLFFGQPGLEQFEATIQHYDKSIAESKLAGAMVSLTKDSKTSKVINVIPDFLLVPFFKLVLWMSCIGYFLFEHTISSGI
jgi:hypothetical protein